MKKASIFLMIIMLALMAGLCFACGPKVPKLDTPQGLAISGTQLSWQEVTDALQYTVEVTDKSDAAAAKKTATLRNAPYSISSLNCNTLYEFRVMALGDDHNSANSSWSQTLSHTTGKQGFVHSYSTWGGDTSPTCTQNGEEKRVCSRCDAFESRDIEALGHDFEWVVTTAPTVTEDGEEREVCKSCQAEGEARVAYALGTQGLLFLANTGGTEYRVALGDATDTNIVIPAYHNRLPVTAIAAAGFGGTSFSSSIISIQAPQTVQTIGRQAFDGCTSLQELVVPFVGESRTAPNENATFGHFFDVSTSFKTGYTQQFHSITDYKYYAIPNSITRVVITDATSIRYGAFSNCSFIKEIELNIGIGVVEDRSFRNCLALQSMTMTGEATEIGTAAFEGCERLATVLLPDSVQTIGNDAFKGCKELTKFIFPKQLRILGNEAFYNCSKLHTVVTNNLIQAIGGKGVLGGTELSGQTFAGTAIKSFNIPGTLVSLGYASFQGTNATIYSDRLDRYEGWAYQALTIGASVVVWGVTFKEDIGIYVDTFAKKPLNSFTSYTASPQYNAPYREGHTFLGWASSEGGEILFSDNAKIASAATGIYHTVWTSN